MRLFLGARAERGPVAHMLLMFGWLRRRREALVSEPPFSMLLLENGDRESLELAMSPRMCRVGLLGW